MYPLLFSKGCASTVPTDSSDSFLKASEDGESSVGRGLARAWGLGMAIKIQNDKDIFGVWLEVPKVFFFGALLSKLPCWTINFDL